MKATVGRLGAGAIALGAALAADLSASAMQVRYDRIELARSADGASTLYEVRGRGPEGGGSLAYRVEGKDRAKRVDFLVSSTFSPGNGSKPQVVPTADCEKRLAALAAESTRRDILGVTAHPDRCRADNREHLVTIATSEPGGVSRTRSGCGL
jgi:hypothetical protein